MLPTYEMIVTRRRTRWAFLLNIIPRLYGQAAGLNIYYFSQPGMNLNIIPRGGRESLDLNIVPRLS